MNRYKFNYLYPGPMLKNHVIVLAENEENAWNEFGRLELEDESDIEVVDIELLPDEPDPNQLSLFE